MVADTGDDEEGTVDIIVVMQHTFAVVVFSLFLAISLGKIVKTHSKL